MRPGSSSPFPLFFAVITVPGAFSCLLLLLLLSLSQETPRKDPLERRTLLLLLLFLSCKGFSRDRNIVITYQGKGEHLIEYGGCSDHIMAFPRLASLPFFLFLASFFFFHGHGNDDDTSSLRSLICLAKKKTGSSVFFSLVEFLLPFRLGDF